VDPVCHTNQARFAIGWSIRGNLPPSVSYFHRSLSLFDHMQPLREVEAAMPYESLEGEKPETVVSSTL
jgi:hypothetical protein